MKILTAEQNKRLFEAIRGLNGERAAKLVKSKPLIAQDVWSFFEASKIYKTRADGYPGGYLTIDFSKLKKPVKQRSPDEEPEQHMIEQTKPVRKGRGVGKKQSKQVTSFALEPELLAALTERAEREERTVSALIRLAIKYYLENVK